MKNMFVLLGVVICAVATLTAVMPDEAEAHRTGTPNCDNGCTDDHPDDLWYWPANWNGYKIYISPAHHWSGWKYGCDDYIEDKHMPDIGEYATYTDGVHDLIDRGYKVRVGVGDPDDARRRSNAWGADRHIAIHSNATSEGQCGGSTGGTIVFNYYGESTSSYLAQELVDKLAPQSPGSQTDYRSHATFHELSNTNMPAAYVETGFHNYQPDKDWLVADPKDVGYYIAWAIDEHLGRPRA